MQVRRAACRRGGSIGSLQQLGGSAEQGGHRQRDPLPLLVRALARAVEHDVQAADDAEAVAAQSPVPGHLVERHDPTHCRAVAADQLVERRHDRQARPVEPALGIVHHQQPADVEEVGPDPGDLPVEDGDEPSLLEQDVAGLEVAVEQPDDRIDRQALQEEVPRAFPHGDPLGLRRLGEDRVPEPDLGRRARVAPPSRPARSPVEQVHRSERLDGLAEERRRLLTAAVEVLRVGGCAPCRCRRGGARP